MATLDTISRTVQGLFGASLIPCGIIFFGYPLMDWARRYFVYSLTRSMLLS
jgi:hypothetical protein